ncbi:PrsW family intramembrane metalloprotease [Streptomyces sp. NPDC059740]|uniref:PrsW family intramembrane metalloprotease n=1 Tax=Streptomyces sp. NPDC059740 TaxID=3346926 RepID=UPI003661DD1F
MPDEGAPGRSWWAQGSVRPSRLRHRLRHSRLLHNRVCDSRVVRRTVLVLGLLLCAAALVMRVRQQTGTTGFFVGLGLALLPVPVLVGVFRWLDRAEPEPWRNLLFVFAWGACAAALAALFVNSLATSWLVASFAASRPTDAYTWGSTMVAPVVEESVKGTAVLLLFLFRRRTFDGVTDGMVLAGITATGFAFTENVLYLGEAFGQDRDLGQTGVHSLTFATFFIRVVMTPFAHPLFTILSGLAFGIAAAHFPHRRPLRIALPLLGLATAALLHSIWNTASNMGDMGFLTVYGLFMVPVFGALTWLALWSRRQDLLALRTFLPPYADAGWLAPHEPLALSSLRTRAAARDAARRVQGRAGARSVAAYAATATTLAALRRHAHRVGPGTDFRAREHVLLERLWQHKAAAGPALAHALHTTRPLLPGLPPRPTAAPASGGGFEAGGRGEAGAPSGGEEGE